MSILVVTLDNTVLDVALPRIQEQLGASQSEQEWIIDAYNLAFAALLFPWGVLGDPVRRHYAEDPAGRVLRGRGAAAIASPPPLPRAGLIRQCFGDVVASGCQRTNVDWSDTHYYNSTKIKIAYWSPLGAPTSTPTRFRPAAAPIPPPPFA